LNFSSFVRNHFSFSFSDNEADNSDIEQKDLKIGNMIDSFNAEKGWIFGKVIEKDIIPYTYQQSLKVFHKLGSI
jgi:hypothetical protein